jgi:hypothetical protein
MFQAARAADGIATLAAFLGLCTVYASKARREISSRLEGPKAPAFERNLRPVIAAERLGISVRKLTRERFTTYRDICVPIEGQTRGYVVNERALTERLVRQRASR